MGSDLVRRVQGSLGLDFQVSRRLPAAVVRAVDNAGHRAVIASANIEAAAYVAHVGLRNLAILTDDEAQLIKMYPLSERRFGVIVDTVAGVVAAEVARMAR